MKISSKKVQYFESRILDFFKKAGREHLPWRRKNISAYEVWVSEIMLQQTQVSRVIGYYEKFLKRFPTVKDLAKATWEEFLPYYQGLGYYARGRNMLKAARVIMKDYGGKFPRDKKLLEKLPGIGPYTAAAIMSFAFEDNHLAWDTNLKRVIGRFFLGGKHLIKDKADWEKRFKTSKKVLNAALMDFGSALCVSRPKCEACTLKSKCTYYQEEGKKESKQNTRYKIRNAGEWSEAVAHVVLHENHRKYFSSQKNKFAPFVLPKGVTTRAEIKRFFLEKYGLTLSVRPPHQKSMLSKGPVIQVNAQILLGKHDFPVFTKKT